MKTFIWLFLFAVPCVIGRYGSSKYSSTSSLPGKEYFDLRKHHVSLVLYTQRNKRTPQTIKSITELPKSNFDPTKLNLFVVHGWGGNDRTTRYQMIKTAALDYHDINYFMFDWSRRSLTLYGFARDAVKPIGQILGRFINQMQACYKLTGSHFTLVGHSLGAHVAGNAGAVVKDKVARIVALDAAEPEFTLYPNDFLNPSHAEYVEAIHTADGKLGLNWPYGHVNYYPSGGVGQNGCSSYLDILGTCDHKRSVQYFTESLKNGPKFEAVQCNSYPEFLLGFCGRNRRSTMGQLIKEKRVYGNFYLETGREAPFAIIDEQTKNETVFKKLIHYYWHKTLSGFLMVDEVLTLFKLMRDIVRTALQF